MRKFYLDFSQKTAKQNDNVSTSGVSTDNKTEPKEDAKNPPDAKKSKYLPGQRSPWTDAGIGGGVGGLLGAALGYLYGHRGRWLAYDTLAGGLGGGAVGYMVGVGNSDNEDANLNAPPKDSKNYHKYVAAISRKDRRKRWGEKYDENVKYVEAARENGGLKISAPEDLHLIAKSKSRDDYIDARMRAEDNAEMLGNMALTNMGNNADSTPTLWYRLAMWLNERAQTEKAHAASAGLVRAPGGGWTARKDFSKTY